MPWLSEPSRQHPREGSGRRVAEKQKFRRKGQQRAVIVGHLMFTKSHGLPLEVSLSREAQLNALAQGMATCTCSALALCSRGLRAVPRHKFSSTGIQTVVCGLLVAWVVPKPSHGSGPERYRRKVCRSEQVDVISMSRKEDPGNYRLVSLTSVLIMKVMKKILLKSISKHMKDGTISLLVGFISVNNSPWTDYSAYSYFQIVTMCDLVMILFFYVIHIFRVYRKLTCVSWPLAEFLHYLIGTILLLIASIVVASKSYNLTGLVAGATFGFLATILCVLSIWSSYKVSCITQSTSKYHVPECFPK
ncbi:PREDICTED: CKLF-like MARVEL transmembrane domain-containing protein 7 [Eurypyga helias]|uniref:CKLF-like MARVEL transmembrane domain-containing protein 7 n=1 Tax=Eurypyga helias TaxID=54383 RepID=UPI0005285A8F|nr:PREDICTED: CKLF-like MARVEL transmembrane domain-containing protein 7 [Eurypyga helias]